MIPYKLDFCLQRGQQKLYRNDSYRAIMVSNHLSRSIAIFTPTEYRLLLLLLKGEAVSDTQMTHDTFHQDASELEKKRIEKHIDNIRGKLPAEIYIYRISAYGYILLESSLAATSA